MTDEIKQPEETKAEQPAEETQGEMMSSVQQEELTEEDKKIAKKRAKKLNITPELAEEARRQEKNVKLVHQLTQEYDTKLKELGFVLKPKLIVTAEGIKPGFDLRPMDGQELLKYNAAKTAIDAEKKRLDDLEKEKQGETMEPDSNGNPPPSNQTKLPMA